MVKVKDKYDLIRFDSSGAVSANMFDESWQRFVIKMATGSGKTKVMSLILAWCFFHKLYEAGSQLARNFLLITPNIIVLDRIRTDFDGLRIFFEDPVLPDNGFEGYNWCDDFQLTLHIQDEVNITRKTGNIFLTNIHRVYSGETTEPSADDEAHHIHDNRLAWFKSIEDIHHRLVEAISQNVVKHPILPDSASRAKLSERKSSRYTEKYADYIHLGVEEWRKAYKEHEKPFKTDFHANEQPDSRYRRSIFASLPGCGRWKSAFSLFNIKDTREPLPSIDTAPRYENSDSIFRHSRFQGVG